ncbi:hypothetical protein AKJ41_05030 [candidate division MSBL1 archaeon SCGC-AAA259O05]|uniref:Uncharacterized protein n=1 Tax=candidate division MSBL1 archaeon SCGC-AAA259O05 TaxID=1698271 RepID=A0A133UZT2_9EURY|nr:hypothetical protein AKJ41_05030 [candidate division MSBL1 archaeon SCGC-AAA259O05]
MESSTNQRMWVDNLSEKPELSLRKSYPEKIRNCANQWNRRLAFRKLSNLYFHRPLPEIPFK